MLQFYDLKTTILQQADDFAEAYYRCRYGVNWQKDEFGRMCAHVVNVPAIVNAAFACELYLKSLINEHVETHNLKTLYESLDEITRNTVSLLINKKIHNYNQGFIFDACLENAANVFVDWRYIYEKEHTEGFMGNSISELLFFFFFFF